MRRVEEQHQDTGFKVIWIGFQDKKEKIVDFMTKHEISAFVGYDKRNLISKQYGVNYGAGLVAIDPQGIVKKRVPKGFSEKTLSEVLPLILPAQNRKAG